jgi:hypothetical protein
MGNDALPLLLLLLVLCYFVKPPLLYAAFNCCDCCLIVLTSLDRCSWLLVAFLLFSSVLLAVRCLAVLSFQQWLTIAPVT